MSIEQVLTLLWAVVLLLLLVGIVWWVVAYVPTKEAEKKECGGFTAFTCSTHNTTQSTTKIKISNRLGATLELHSAKCDFPECRCTPPSRLAAGEGGDLLCSHAAPAKIGEAYTTSITITYLNTVDGLIYVDRGRIKGLVEPS